MQRLAPYPVLATALSPLVCLSRSARPPSLFYPNLTKYNFISKQTNKCLKYTDVTRKKVQFS